MKVLIVARCKNGRYAPFITEQVDALRRQGVDCQFFPVTRKGLRGYLGHVSALKDTIRSWQPDLIHAHYGMCGLLANLQRRVPVVTTYHGSDINLPNVLRLSRWAMRLSAFNIFVSEKNIDLARPKKHFALVPCGVTLEDYPVLDKQEARRMLALEDGKQYVLFAGAFDNAIKNAPLAQAAVNLLDGPELLELKGYTRAQVAALMQAVDALLMTSHSEGSPQVIKEALLCGCPIVSIDVGDVCEITEGVEGCYISETNPVAIAEALRKALNFQGRTAGREVILRKGLTNDTIAAKILKIYQQIIS